MSDPTNPIHVLASITRPGRGSGCLERAGWLTPYVAEMIAEDALGAGRGARLDLVVLAQTGDAALGRVEERFGWLRARGLDVRVRRNRHPETDEHTA